MIIGFEQRELRSKENKTEEMRLMLKSYTDSKIVYFPLSFT